MAFVMVPVTGRFRQPDGVTPAAGVVEFILTAAIQDADSNEIRVPTSVLATLDAAGSFSVLLTSTQPAGVQPRGVTYTVIERIVGAPLRVYQIAI